MITDVEPFYTTVNYFDNDTENIIYTLCSRSNNRLWLANLQGHVERTLKVTSSSFGHLAYCHNNYLLTWNPRTVTKHEGISIHLLCLSQLRTIQKFTLYSKFHATCMRIIATSWDRHAKQAAFIVQEFEENFQNDSIVYPFFTVYILSFKFHITSPNITQLALAKLQSSPNEFFCIKPSLPSNQVQLLFQDFYSHQGFMNKKNKTKGKHLTTSKFSIISTLQTQPFTLAWYTWFATHKRVVFVWHKIQTWYKKDTVNFLIPSSIINVSQHKINNGKIFPARSSSLENVSQDKKKETKNVTAVSLWFNSFNGKPTTQALFGSKLVNRNSLFLFKNICINHHYSFLDNTFYTNASWFSHSSFSNPTPSTSYVYSFFVYFTSVFIICFLTFYYFSSCCF
jgi:hypothetical protein